MNRCSGSLLWRWVLAVTWTALCAYLLLWPGEDTPVEDVSGAFGGTDLTDAVGHVGLLFGQAVVLFTLLGCYTPPAQARRRAIGGALIWGAALELAQHWIPGRGFALLDLSANALGVALFAWVSVYVLRMRRAQSRQQKMLRRPSRPV